MGSRRAGEATRRVARAAAWAALGAVFSFGGCDGCDGNTNTGTVFFSVTRRISLSGAGAEGNEASLTPSISADGRYVAFASRASNLHPDDPSQISDIYVRDVETGQVTLVSRADGPAGAAGNDNSFRPSISADGRIVAFESIATNLVSGEFLGGRNHIFVRDLAAGTTTFVSRESYNVKTRREGPHLQAQGNFAPSISGDGRYVAFEHHSSATDRHVYVRDTLERRTIPVSSDVNPFGSNTKPSISADGRTVAFTSRVPYLPDEKNDNSLDDVYVRDLRTGRITLVSRRSTAIGGFGPQGGNGPSDMPSISADGRYVAFESDATNLLGVGGDGNGKRDVFLRDLYLGTMTRVSVSNSGVEGIGASTHPSLSADGRAVAFVSESANFVNGDTNASRDIFVRDLSGGATVRASVQTYGQEAGGDSTWPSLSRDGRFVAFQSVATDMVQGDNNTATDVFLRGPLFSSSPGQAGPAALDATAGNGQVTLVWSAVTGATSYTLYFATAPGVTRSNFASLPGGTRVAGVASPLVQTGLSNNATYFFAVTADTGSGESDESHEARATPSSWTRQNDTPARTPFLGVSFIDVTRGRLVGGAGEILATGNAGRTWTAQNSGTAVDLTDVHFAGATTGWIVGRQGTIRATTDGGATWSPQTSGTTQDLQGVSFANALNGWAVGAAGTILATTNG